MLLRRYNYEILFFYHDDNKIMTCHWYNIIISSDDWLSLGQNCFSRKLTPVHLLRTFLDISAPKVPEVVNMDLQLFYFSRLGVVLGKSKQFVFKPKTFIELMEVWEKDRLVSEYVGIQKEKNKSLLGNVEKLRVEFEVGDWIWTWWVDLFVVVLGF